MQDVDESDGGPSAEDAFLFGPRDPVAGKHLEAMVLRAAQRVRRPRLLIDGQCQVLWASASASDLLKPPLPLTIREGHLCATTRGEQARAWTTFVEGVGGTEGRLFIHGRASGTWVLVRAWEEWPGGSRAVFVECVPSSPLRDVVSSGLTADFGLTRSEGSVLDLFARLMKPNDIADALGVSLSTVRSHLKQIHTKMAVNSSTQLLRITHAYCDR